MSVSVPGHWTSFTNPIGWFKVSHPPTWQAESEGDLFAVQAPDHAGLLTIKAVWMDHPPADLDVWVRKQGLFPRSRKIKKLPPAQEFPDSLVYCGEADMSVNRKWWQFWRPRTRRNWKLWCILNKNVCWLALFVDGRQPDPETKTLAQMIVRSTSFVEEPAEPPTIFANRVLQNAKTHFPSIQSLLAKDKFCLRFGHSTIELGNVYRAYLQAPDRFEEIVLPALTTVAEALKRSPEQFDPPLDDVRSRIMPMFYPQPTWKDQLADFIGLPWIANLAVLYVVDEAQSYWFIQNRLLQRWGITADEIHELALKNLDRYFRDSPMEFTVVSDEDVPRMLIPTRPDAYNSVRILSPGFQKQVRDLLGQEFAAGIPNRDFFIAVSTMESDVLDHMREKITQDFQQMNHPVCDCLLLVTNDGVSEFPADES